MSAPLLEVRGLDVRFRAGARDVQAVRGVSFTLARGEVLGVVGESGSGKSVTSLAAMGLLVDHPGARISGEVLLEGERIDTLDLRGRRALFGRRLAMVFQDPMTSLNPFLTIGIQIAEVFETHAGLSRREALDRAVESLDRCGIRDARERIHRYPHEFSGGMRQRVMIAQALAGKPDVLFLDEPTTALDVTTQAQVIDLLRDLAQSTGTAMIFISHDLAVVASIAARVLVMYAGEVVEEAPASAIFSSPGHPYTRALARSIPSLDADRGVRLAAIPGRPPVPGETSPGCAFAPRCAAAIPACTIDRPAIVRTGTDAWRRCAVSMPADAS